MKKKGYTEVEEEEKKKEGRRRNRGGEARAQQRYKLCVCAVAESSLGHNSSWAAFCLLC